MNELTHNELVTALRNCSESIVYCDDCPAVDICDGGNSYPPVWLLREAANRIESGSARHGHWFLSDECANAGVYCSVCTKKVYKEQYANVKPKSKFCPHCGSIMDGDFIRL